MKQRDIFRQIAELDPGPDPDLFFLIFRMRICFDLLCRIRIQANSDNRRDVQVC
jgi:hypothetical protein